MMDSELPCAGLPEGLGPRPRRVELPAPGVRIIIIIIIIISIIYMNITTRFIFMISCSF